MPTTEAIVRNAGPAATVPKEAQLSAIWRGRRFPHGALVTRAGVPVRVIFQGRPGRGPGPDFRGAVIAGPSGVPLRGDIELHVRASDFQAHGHATDPAYAGVILHVVFEDDTGADTPLPGGGSAPVIALGPWVARRSEELIRWIEQPLLWREPCHSAVMRLGREGALAALDAAGDQRLEAKRARFAAQAAAGGAEQALYEGLMEAFGYGGNSAAMLALARLLRWHTLMRIVGQGGGARVMTAEAALLGSAGLLPSQRRHHGPVEQYVESLEQTFRRMGLRSLPAAHWKLWGVRPANMPARRVAAAAALFSRVAPGTVFTWLAAKTASELCAPLMSLRADGYWRNHHDPCAGPSRMPAAFIGRSRALEVIANVVIPAALACGTAAQQVQARVWWERLPRPATYGATRFIEEALANDSGAGRLPINARRAQGLLELNIDWCTKNGCGRCRLSQSGVLSSEF